MQAVVAHAALEARERREEASRQREMDVHQLPPEAQWIRASEFDKQAVVGEKVWTRRRVIMVEDELLFARLVNDEIVDRLDLCSVLDVIMDEDYVLMPGVTGDKNKRKADTGAQSPFASSSKGLNEGLQVINISRTDEWGRISHTMLRGKIKKETKHEK
jgi:hypothetical protein